MISSIKSTFAIAFFALSFGYHLKAEAGPLSAIVACIKSLTFGEKITAPPHKSEDQVSASARRLMIAGPGDFTNFHANAVDFIAVKAPGLKGEEKFAYNVLIMIRAEEAIAASLKKALEKRFPNLIQSRVYVDRDGKQHQVLAIAPHARETQQGYELPAAELLIISARDALMANVQALQSKSRAGIMYVLNYSATKDRPWFGSENTGFQVPLHGGENATNW